MLLGRVGGEARKRYRKKCTVELRREGSGSCSQGVEVEPTQHALVHTNDCTGPPRAKLGCNIWAPSTSRRGTAGWKGGARPYVTLGEEWKDGNFCVLPSPTARRQLGDTPQSKELKEPLRAWEEMAEPERCEL